MVREERGCLVMGGKRGPAPGGRQVPAGVPGVGPNQLLDSHALPSSAAELRQSQAGNESLPRIREKVDPDCTSDGEAKGKSLAFPTGHSGPPDRSQ